MQIWTNLKREKFMSELPPQSPFRIKTSNLKKLVVTTPFQTKDVSEGVTAKDIQSLMEHNNYTNKYLQSLGGQILASEQVGESFSKPSSSKQITKPLFKPYKFLLEKKKNLNKVETTDVITKLEIAKMINQIDKKLSEVVIPETPPADKSSRIQTLNKASKISSSDGKDPRIEAIKIIANWRAP